MSEGGIPLDEQPTLLTSEPLYTDSEETPPPDPENTAELAAVGGAEDTDDPDGSSSSVETFDPGAPRTFESAGVAEPTPPARVEAATLALGDPTTEAVTCPECGAMQQVALSRREANDFCRNCDFPLFWTPALVIRGDQNMS